MDLLLNNAIALAGSMGASALNYVFHTAMARMLSRTDYGELSVIIGLITIITIPTGSLYSIFAREIAKLDVRRREAEINDVVHSYSRKAFIVGFLISIFILAYAVMSGYWVLAFIAPIVPLAYATSIAIAYLQGKEKILWVSIINVLTIFAKLIVAIVLVYFGFALVGALVSYTFAYTAALLVLFYLLFYRLKERKKHELKISGMLLRVMITQVVLALYLYMDLFMVRHYVGVSDAAAYNVAGITSRLLYYMTTGLVVAFLPASSKLDFKNKREIGIALLKTFAFLPPVFFIFILFPREIMVLFFTQSYADATIPFFILSIAMLFFSFFFILLNLMWSQREECFPLKLVCIVYILHTLVLVFSVPTYGVVGAALTTLMTSFLLFLVSAAYTGLKLAL